ncbi:MAG: ClpXP protease specificity-enhancing factor SspB [bacterium]
MEKDDIRQRLNELKKTTFYELLNLIGRVFIVVRYSENVIIGNRGFLPEERQKGLILVLNSTMNFMWDDYGISTKLVFGNSVERCFIPTDDIVSIYSPELSSQLIVGPQTASEPHGPEGTEKTSHPHHIEKETEEESPKGEDRRKSKVVKVDFQKRRK